MPTVFYEVSDGAFSKARAGELDNTEAVVEFLVAEGQGSRFPESGPFLAVVHDDAFDADDPFSDPDMEIVVGTSRTGDAVTLSRTSPKAHQGTPWFQILMMAAHVQQLQQAIATIENREPKQGALEGIKNEENLEFLIPWKLVEDSVAIIQDCLELSPGDDYSISFVEIDGEEKTMITFIDAPHAGDSLRYRGTVDA